MYTCINRKKKLYISSKGKYLQKCYFGIRLKLSKGIQIKTNLKHFSKIWIFVMNNNKSK